MSLTVQRSPHRWCAGEPQLIRPVGSGLVTFIPRFPRRRSDRHAPPGLASSRLRHVLPNTLHQSLADARLTHLRIQSARVNTEVPDNLHDCDPRITILSHMHDIVASSRGNAYGTMGSLWTSLSDLSPQMPPIPTVDPTSRADYGDSRSGTVTASTAPDGVRIDGVVGELSET